MIEIGRKAYLLFDGDCGICTYFSKVARRVDRRGIFAIAPYQSFPETELAQVGISYAACQRKLQVVSRQGRVYAGAVGLNYFLFHYSPWALLVAVLYLIPLLFLLEVAAYALVARLRHRLSTWFGLRACSINRA